MVTKHPSPPKIIHAIEKFSWQNARTPFCHQASWHIYLAIIFSRWCLLQSLRGAIDRRTTEVALCNRISTWSFRTIFYKSWLKLEYVLFPLPFASKFFFSVNYHIPKMKNRDFKKGEKYWKHFFCWSSRRFRSSVTWKKRKKKKKKGSEMAEILPFIWSDLCDSSAGLSLKNLGTKSFCPLFELTTVALALK